MPGRQRSFLVSEMSGKRAGVMVVIVEGPRPIPFLAPTPTYICIGDSVRKCTRSSIFKKFVRGVCGQFVICTARRVADPLRNREGGGSDFCDLICSMDAAPITARCTTTRAAAGQMEGNPGRGTS